MKLKVGVFFGGKACEHEISCISASQALNALDQDKYEVIPVYIAKNGDMYTGEELWQLANFADLDALCAKLTKVSLVKDSDKVYLREVKDSVFKKSATWPIDVAFLVMHGTNGEDGTLQGLMEIVGLPYTSSGVMASAIGQDKVIMKEVLAYNGLPLVDWTYFTRLEMQDGEGVKNKVAKIGYPMILKPANLGSSIGIEVVHSEEEFEKKAKEALRYDDKILVEKYLEDFKEVNCSIIGDIDGFKVSVLEEVLKQDEILSFENKYVSGSKGGKTKLPSKGTKGGMANTSRLVPAPLEKAMSDKIKEYALKAYRAMDAYGVCRIDFMVDKDDNIYLTELNSIPGSLAFYLWSEEGVDFSKECDLLIEGAIKRYRHKEKMSFSFDTNILSTFKGGK